jgi:hypothetical protein
MTRQEVELFSSALSFTRGNLPAAVKRKPARQSHPFVVSARVGVHGLQAVAELARLRREEIISVGIGLTLLEAHG